MACSTRRLLITEPAPENNYISDDQKADNSVEESMDLQAFLKTLLVKLSASARLKVAVNSLINLFGKIIAKYAFWAGVKKFGGTLCSYSFELAKEELLEYYRLEQYVCYANIDDAQKYIRQIIDEYKTILLNKKKEVIIINGQELTYRDYISQLSEDQPEILVQILPKKGNESLTYGDLQKLTQTVEAQKKQGGPAVFLDCENLSADHTDKIEYMNEIQKYINQKNEDILLLDKIPGIDYIEKRKEKLKKELTASSVDTAGKNYLKSQLDSLNEKIVYTDNRSEQLKMYKDIKKLETDLQILKDRENVVSDIISSCKSVIIYPPVEKTGINADNTDKNRDNIVTPASSTEYKVITENDGIVLAVYAGKAQYLAKTYYRSASGHFYNKNGQEEKPSVLYNSDRTLRSVVNYDSEENGQKILLETVFANDDSKTISSVTHYKYDVNGMFMWKYTEVFDIGVNDGNNPSIKEKHYYNQAGNLCKTEKMYCVNGVNHCDVYSYSDGKINDNPCASYILVNNKRKKI